MPDLPFAAEALQVSACPVILYIHGNCAYNTCTMHRYFRTIGFSEYHNEEEVRHLLDVVQQQNEPRAMIISRSNGDRLWEIRAELGPGLGVILSGYVNHLGQLVRERYMPFFEEMELTSDVYCAIQRHVDNNVFSGLLDDIRVGISLIFRLTNAGEYMQRRQRGQNLNPRGVSLTAFSRDGKILLPIKKDAKMREKARVADQNREKLIEAARHGDESAIEALNNEDMGMYNSLTRRMMKEDIYSIVESCFMPQGIECDIYQIIGDILEISTRRNLLTGEDIWDFLIQTNDLPIHVVTNQIDLQGEPEVGRRFKGTVWIQGRAIFEA